MNSYQYKLFGEQHIFNNNYNSRGFQCDRISINFIKEIEVQMYRKFEFNLTLKTGLDISDSFNFYDTIFIKIYFLCDSWRKKEIWLFRECLLGFFWFIWLLEFMQFFINWCSLQIEINVFVFKISANQKKGTFFWLAKTNCEIKFQYPFLNYYLMRA